MCAVAEPPTTPDRPAPLGAAVRLNEWISTPHRRKETLLPQIVQLA